MSTNLGLLIFIVVVISMVIAHFLGNNAAAVFVTVCMLLVVIYHLKKLQATKSHGYQVSELLKKMETSFEDFRDLEILFFVEDGTVSAEECKNFFESLGKVFSVLEIAKGFGITPQFLVIFRELTDTWGEEIKAYMGVLPESRNKEQFKQNMLQKQRLCDEMLEPFTSKLQPNTLVPAS